MIEEICLEQIRPNPWQPRLKSDEDDVQSLANAIKHTGLLNPVTVRKKIDWYEIIAGHRRLKAFKQLGYEKIPAIVKEVNDQQMLELTLVENLQRKTISPIEEAKAFARLQKDFKLIQSEIAANLGLTRDYVAQRLRLLSFPEEIQEFVSHDTISVSVAEAMASAPQELRQQIISRVSTGWRPTVAEIKTEIDAFTRPIQEHNAAQPKRMLVDDILRTVLTYSRGLSEDEYLVFSCPKCLNGALEYFEVRGENGWMCSKCHHTLTIE